MSKLLINEPPVIIIPSLAAKLGVKEAVMLQQMHYWLLKSRNIRNERKWVYNTYKDWHQQLPFWSESTLKRTIQSLERQGYVQSAMFNRSKMDQTKWYTVDYRKLAELAADMGTGLGTMQTAPLSEPSLPDEEGRLSKPIPERTTETAPEKKPIPFSEVIDHLNSLTKSAYKPGTGHTRDLIKARFNEGFTLEDMKKVIDLKAAEWGHDPFWRRFLRPETLFGPKFESYLNQKPHKKGWREEEFDLDD